MPALPDGLRLYFTIQLRDATHALYTQIGMAVKGVRRSFCGDAVRKQSVSTLCWGRASLPLGAEKYLFVKYVFPSRMMIKVTHNMFW